MTPSPTEAQVAYMLRTSDADRRSYGGFQWPESGPVSCPDWDPTKECGGGLHGLLHGVGAGILLSVEDDAVWQVIAVDPATAVDLGRKVKVPSGSVAFSGPKDGALAFLDAHGCADKPVAFATRTAGDCGTATAGYGGTATAGERGTATAGYGGTATAGERGTATAGDRGTATAGDGGTATAETCGTATAGERGTATAGDGGTATAGHRGTATTGDKGTLLIHWLEGTRYRISVGYAGEGGIKANTAYRCDGFGQLVEAAT